MLAIDLFAGIGGWTEGAEQAGATVVPPLLARAVVQAVMAA